MVPMTTSMTDFVKKFTLKKKVYLGRKYAKNENLRSFKNSLFYLSFYNKLKILLVTHQKFLKMKLIPLLLMIKLMILTLLVNSISKKLNKSLMKIYQIICIILYMIELYLNGKAKKVLLMFLIFCLY